MPAKAKTVSVSTAPESSRPVCSPIVVTTGSMALRSMCRRRDRRRRQALGLAPSGRSPR